jgi:hypothetical protein
LVVSVGAPLPGGEALASNGLPVFAQACLVRRMDWSHCPVLGLRPHDLLRALAFSWSMPLRLGARVWVEAPTPLAALPAAVVFLQAAGLDRTDVDRIDLGGKAACADLVRVWEQMSQKGAGL